MRAQQTHYDWFGLLLAALLLFAALLPRPLIAQEYGIIDDIRFGYSEHGPQIRISFTQAAQYIGHSPEKQSRQLFIDLRLVGPPPTEVLVPQQQQLRFTPTNEVPLTTVSYREVGRNTARLELDFTRVEHYTVTTRSDFRGITVTLLTARQEQPLPKSTREPVSVPREPHAAPRVEKQAAGVMEMARKALVEKRDYPRAIALYQQVLALPANSHSREALELLGLARERFGQRAQAKAVYEAYLKRYPSGEDSERVRQRLMSLVTAALPEHQQLRKGKNEGEAQWEVFGSLSQFYLRNTLRVESAAIETTASAVSTDLDLIGLRRSSRFDTRLRITAGHYHDLMADANGSDTRVSALYAEQRDRKLGWWARAGRQSGNRDGALGRFDGLKLGYAINKNFEASVVAGHPVDSSRDSIDNSRTFTGAAVDIGPFADNWEFSLYGLTQKEGPMVDRRAVGGEVRYFTPKLMLLGLADYDTFHRKLNIGTLLTSWTLKNDLTLNASIDVRKTPILTTRNALIGQSTGPATAPVPVLDITELRTLYPDDAIYQLALDRTAEIRTGSIGFSNPLTERLRLAGDLTVMHTSATVASPPSLGDVPATPATDNEFFLNLQAIGTGMLNGDDISTIGLNFSNTTTSRSVGLFTSSRLPVGTRLRFYPRLRIDHRSWKESVQHQWKLNPVLRIEYGWDKASLEGEIGGEWTNRELPDDTTRTLGVYGSIGYRYRF